MIQNGHINQKSEDTFNDANGRLKKVFAEFSTLENQISSSEDMAKTKRYK